MTSVLASAAAAMTRATVIPDRGLDLGARSANLSSLATAEYTRPSIFFAWHT